MCMVVSVHDILATAILFTVIRRMVLITGVGAARMSEYRLKVSELPDQRDAPPLARRFCEFQPEPRF